VLHIDSRGLGEPRFRVPHPENTPSGALARAKRPSSRGERRRRFAFKRDDDLMDELVEESIARLRGFVGHPELESILAAELEGDLLDAALLVWDLPDDEVVEELRDARVSAREIFGDEWTDVEAIALVHRTDRGPRLRRVRVIATA